jgi:hypothetical protein
MKWDWHNAVQDPGLHRQRRRVLELIEEHWRVMPPTGRVVTCAAYRIDGPGIEVRAGYSVDHFHQTQRVADLTHARVVADMWRASIAAKGLKELPIRNGAQRRFKEPDASGRSPAQNRKQKVTNETAQSRGERGDRG